MDRLREWSRHAIPLAFCVLLSALWMHPALANLRTRIIGSGAGDNVSFVWNIWWARTALLSVDETLFWTPMLFAPYGTSLVLHSLAPLPSAAAATLVSWLSPIGAYNVISWLTVSLNGACAYAAGYVLTRMRLPAFACAMVFSGAPFLLVRLQGHLSVLSAWALPLLVVVLVTLNARPTLALGFVLGLVLTILAYTDYYYCIFGVVLVLVYLVATRWHIQISVRAGSGARRRFAIAAVAVSLCLFGISLWAVMTGGTMLVVLGQEVSVRSGFNARVAAWILIVWAIISFWVPVCSLERQPEGAPGVWRSVAAAAVTLVALVLPLLVAATALWRSGDYVSQAYHWRSAPPGIDAAALFLGHPFGLVMGPAVAPLFDACNVDRVESAVWLGFVPLLLCGVAILRYRQDPDIRVWLVIGGLFGLWALGPYLTVCGWNTAMMLPQTLLRFVPVVANARIPGRAFVVVLLCVALLVALALSRMRGGKPGLLLPLLAVVGILLDYWPAPHPLTRIQHSSVDRTLARLEPGIVLDVPFGFRDGFGERGRLDHLTLIAQTVHRHPMMGGFVARLSPRITEAYESDPVLRALLDASETGDAPHVRPPSGQGVPRIACSARYLRVNRAALSHATRRVMERAFVLEPIAADERHALYEIRALRGVSCPSAPASDCAGCPPS